MSTRYKLIISDLDRTLLPSKELPLSKEVFSLVTDLEKAGVRFAVASGRQYSNLKRLFYPIRDSVIFIPENGSWISYRGETMYESEIARDAALAIIDDILKDDCKEVLVSGKHTYYMKPRTEQFLKRMFCQIKATVTMVDDFSDIQEPIIKISAYDARGIEGFGAAGLIAKWSGTLNAVVSNRIWVDLTVGDKGTAAAYVMKHFGVSSGETAVFGDDNNDIPLFGVTENSWCMSEAAEEVKKEAQHTTTDTVAEIRKLLWE